MILPYPAGSDNPAASVLAALATAVDAYAAEWASWTTTITQGVSVTFNALYCKYKVVNNDSWVSLAATAGMPPWDLIRYNYPGLPADLQQAAREVNWYLQEYVGCTTL